METQQKDYSSIETQLKLSMLHGAFCAYDVDLDLNTVVKKFKTLQMESGVDLLSEANLEVPCSYTKLTEEIAGFMPAGERQRYISLSAPGYLIEQYQQGILLPQIEFNLQVEGKNTFYLRERFYLYRAEELGNLMAFIVIEDKTDMMSHFRQLEKDARIGRRSMIARNNFLSDISHDIRTPMNAIMGFALLALSHKESEEKTDEYLTKIMSSSTHLLNLLNAVIDLQEGTEWIEGMEHSCNIGRLLNDIRDILTPRAEEKRIYFQVDASKITNKEVYADKLKLNQIIMNLLSNSIRMTDPNGAVSLYASQKPIAKEGYAAYEFRVEDSGNGMTREQAMHVLDPSGIGYSEEFTLGSEIEQGFSVTKELLDSMDGFLEVETDLGMGTAIIVTLHLRLAEEEKNDIDKLDLSFLYEDRVEIDFTGKRVLIVEDNDLNREIAEEILEDEGFIVESVGDGQQAVDKIKASSEGYFDLVLMDIQMPIMDGYEATWNIRNLQRSDTAFLPVIAMTANTLEEDKQKAFASGMNAHLSKPITVDSLLNTLSEVLSNVVYEL